MSSSSAPTLPFKLENTFSGLPEHFFSFQVPEQVAQPQLIRCNPELAEQLGIDPDWLVSGDALAIFSGNAVAADTTPIATAYSGHQFGNFNPYLGDGRAVLLGEVVATNGQRYDIQLKGSGRTPYSRSGDGRAPLGPVLREYIVSEAMAALGIPTTRSLIAVTSGEPVIRDQRLPGAVLTRVARSHIRVGHFQHYAAREDHEGVRVLADHVIARDFPEIDLHSEDRYMKLLEAAIARQAKLIAQWQLTGFIHGVMNTDNMLICGETIDYGPCAFMDTYDPNTCFSSIDHGKRYAYQNQPGIAHWNLSWFAQSLLPLINADHDQGVQQAQAALNAFKSQYLEHYTKGLLRKFGLSTHNAATEQFINDFLTRMFTEQCDFTLTFRHLTDRLHINVDDYVPVDYSLPESFNDLVSQWQSLIPDNAEAAAMMRTVNPALIPRNHQVEKAINNATDGGDLRHFHRLVDALATPMQLKKADLDLTRPPEAGEEVLRTFCGT